MISLKRIVFLTACVLLLHTSYAQGVITIDHKTQRFINDVSTLDRTKYVNAHITIRDADPIFDSFKTEFNVHPDYIGSRSFWNPVSRIKDGNIPSSVPNNFSGVREVDPFYITGGLPQHLFWDATEDYSVTDVTDYSRGLAEYLAKSFKTEWT
ncbi:MAG: hypothetical protein AAF551_09430, partial [Bacteroidota bacterium]